MDTLPTLCISKKIIAKNIKYSGNVTRLCHGEIYR